MPTNQKVKTFATGIGSYSHPGLHAFIATQGASASANYKMSVAYVAPYVSGILPGWSIGTKPVQGVAEYSIIRAVYLTTITAITGTGAAGAGATANLLIYRAGASAATAATLAFNTGVNTVGLTAKALTVSATLSNVKVRFGDLLVFQWLQGGTGLALPEAMIQVDLV